jgi:hypothetical protein
VIKPTCGLREGYETGLTAVIGSGVRPSKYVAVVFEIIAILASPVIALVVSGWIAEAKEQTKRRHQVFQSLWLTRNDMNMIGGRMSPEHVRALNMIEIEFTATGLDRFYLRVERCDGVLEAWHVYRQAFMVEDFADNTSADAQAFFAARDMLLVDLLAQMSELLGLQFTRNKIVNSSYAPKGHTQVEFEIAALRTALLAIAQGRQPLHVTSAPPQRSPKELPASPVVKALADPEKSDKG